MSVNKHDTKENDRGEESSSRPPVNVGESHPLDPTKLYSGEPADNAITAPQLANMSISPVLTSVCLTTKPVRNPLADTSNPRSSPPSTFAGKPGMEVALEHRRLRDEERRQGGTFHGQWPTS